MMRNIAVTTSLGLALGLLASASLATAETVTTSKTTTYAGTVSEMDPSSSTIILRSETAPRP